MLNLIYNQWLTRV